MRHFLNRTIFCLAMLVFVPTTLGAESIHWMTDFEQARQIAQQSQRLLLLHFATEWCGPCKRLEKNVFPASTVSAAIGRSYVPVKIDCDHNPALAARFEVDRYPTDVIITADGREVFRAISSQDAARYAATLERVASSENRGSFNASFATATAPAQSTQAAYNRFSSDSPDAQPPQFAAQHNHLASQPSTRSGGFFDDRYQGYQAPPNSQPQTPFPNAAHAAAVGNNTMPRPGANGQPASYASQPFQQGSPPVSANPFSPPQVQSNPYVNSSGGNQWNSPQTTVGASHHLSRPQDDRTTVTQPPSNDPAGRNQPPAATSEPPLALDGYCPVSLAEREQWIEGDARWGIVHRGHTYLFASPDQRDKFWASPDRYSPVLAGNDPTIYIDGGQIVAGQRRHGMWYQGKMYLFANEQSLARFSQHPEFYAEKCHQIMMNAGG